MDEKEKDSIEPLKYQLRQWRELVNKYLPPTNCDRDDVEAIESLIKRAISKSAPAPGLSDAQQLAKLCIENLTDTCMCHDDYKRRNKRDPSCEYCDVGIHILPLATKITQGT